MLDWCAGLEEALIASLADAEGGDGATGAPAASKHAVKSLVREQLTEQRLQQLGGSGTECAVCRCAASCCVMQQIGIYHARLKCCNLLLHQHGCWFGVARRQNGFEY